MELQLADHKFSDSGSGCKTVDLSRILWLRQFQESIRVSPKREMSSLESPVSTCLSTFDHFPYDTKNYTHYTSTTQVENFKHFERLIRYWQCQTHTNSFKNSLLRNFRFSFGVSLGSSTSSNVAFKNKKSFCDRFHSTDDSDCRHLWIFCATNSR